jgi:PKHD-type hydroxylase
MDVGYGEVNRRKLSLTVQLSDPSEYEGGDFHIWYGGDEGQFITMPKEKGTVLIFPSFLMHRVTPVTKGTRKALVFWTGGEPYK